MNFDWGYGPITNYRRVYFSIRWWGKIKRMTTEEYTFYDTADGVRFFVNHKMIIDSWGEVYRGKKSHLPSG